ncbi:MAG: L-threonine 3-dehydrogenase [bacterium]|jgi:threonine 3-dehydrogenase
MQAIAKVERAPGAQLIEVNSPEIKPGHVRVKVLRTSVCGTDFHIFNWDEWSQGRIHPPRILGHEMCGIITEVGEGVSERKVGDYVASESHIVCGKCVQCLAGQGHVCKNTLILGVDVDGVFAPDIVIPEANARLTDTSVSPEIASIQDPLGNAIHAALATPLEGRTVLVMGCGPIGLFAIAVCKAMGAKQTIAVEVSPYRLNLAEAMGANVLLNPKNDNIEKTVLEYTGGIGVDVVLEMSGHPSSLNQAINLVRSGGRLSLFGIYPKSEIEVNLNEIIFKGLLIQGTVGRKLYETWDQMHELLSSGKLNVAPVITHTLHYTEFAEGMELIRSGNCGKLVFHVAD